MGIVKKTFKKLGLTKPKFNPIMVLHADYMAFKAYSAYFKIPNYEMFTKMLVFFTEGFNKNYPEENSKLRDNIAKLLAIIWQYERRYGKLFDSSKPNQQKM